MKKGISIFLCLLLLLIMLVGCGGEKTQILGDITFTYNSTIAATVAIIPIVAAIPIDIKQSPFFSLMYLLL